MVAASGWKKAFTDATLTIAPVPLSTIAVRAARLARSAMKKFICMAQAKSSSLVPKNPCSRIRTAPTLLTSTSSRPCSSIARPISCAGPSAADRSTAIGVTPLRPARLPVVSEPATTCAPSPARAFVTASPIPLPAPVTTATLPARLRSIEFSFRTDISLRYLARQSRSGPVDRPRRRSRPLLPQLRHMTALCGCRTASRPRGSCPGRLGQGEALHEGEGGVGDLPPAAVDGQRVAAAAHLNDLGHVLVVLLVLVGGIGDRPRDGVVLLAGDEQQRPAAGIFGVDLRLGPRVEVGRRRLEQRQARGGHGEGLVELFRLVLRHGVGERVAELVVGERDRAVPVGRVAQRR